VRRHYCQQGRGGTPPWLALNLLRSLQGMELPAHRTGTQRRQKDIVYTIYYCVTSPAATIMVAMHSSVQIIVKLGDVIAS
jgi:hypothetical protein